MRRVLCLALVVALTLSLATAAALGAEPDAAALAKAIQNPLATVTTLPFQFNWNPGVGAYDRTFFNLNVQPVIPFAGEKWNVINRPIIPINSVPSGETESTFGIGDTTYQLFFSPAKAGKVIWGLGPVAYLPTASNPQVLGTGKWGAGPAGVIFIMAGKFTMGGVASNVWSFAGAEDRPDINAFTAQWFLNYNLGGGWALGTAPVVTANWEADSGEQWTVPWGAQISKVTKFGQQHVNVLLGYYTNSEVPTGGADHQVRFQVNFLYPNMGKR